jgi:hypothetical protein
MQQRAFWITLAIILFYLIARPRIGTVWRVTLPPPTPLPSGLTPVSPPPGFVADRPPPQAFTEKSDCLVAAYQFRQEGGVDAGAYCEPRYTLVWGW